MRKGIYTQCASGTGSTIHGPAGRVLCAEGIWTRYLPSRKMISDIISSGAIGTPISITANLGYELTGVERLMNPALGGGALLDVGVYAINFALMVFGEDYESITSGGSI